MDARSLLSNNSCACVISSEGREVSEVAKID